MKNFLIKQNTEVLAVSYSKEAPSSIEAKKTNKEVIYSLEDVQVDPVGKLGSHKESVSLGGQFARDGFYGFKLPNNKKGYETMLVHQSDVIAI